MIALQNKKTNIIPVILAGGVGSRLWPLSRENHPKPFIKLDDGQSLIQKAYLRAVSIANAYEVLTVTNRELFFYTKDEYAEVQNRSVYHSFILEPFSKNSTAAIALAAHHIKEEHGDNTIMLVLPADHLIKYPDIFLAAVDQAVKLCCEEKLVTFGIKPDTPKTGYGYIETDGHNVLRFVEKPDAEKAQEYLSSGNFLWNSGIFCMQAGTILDDMDMYCPTISSQSRNCLKNAAISQGKNWVQKEVHSKDFSTVEELSIDYAIFEKSAKVAVVSCDIGWSDIGSWLEFGQLYPADQEGNHILGEVVLEDVKNCIIHSENRMAACIGLQDLVIADTSDAILVTSRNRVQDVKLIVKRLKNLEHNSYQLFPKVHRPWGNYTVLQEGDGFKLKHIKVKPGSALSLQSHRYRSEHWIVVNGTARVVNEEQELFLAANQSTYIPAGNKHRLENPGDEILNLIEIQCGSYLGEDDIVRFDDLYGR